MARFFALACVIVVLAAVCGLCDPTPAPTPAPEPPTPAQAPTPPPPTPTSAQPEPTPAPGPPTPPPAPVGPTEAHNFGISTATFAAVSIVWCIVCFALSKMDSGAAAPYGKVAGGPQQGPNAI